MRLSEECGIKKEEGFFELREALRSPLFPLRAKELDARHKVQHRHVYHLSINITSMAQYHQALGGASKSNVDSQGRQQSELTRVCGHTHNLIAYSILAAILRASYGGHNLMEFLVR